ncbi:MAG: hypothetical protein GXP56_13125 [Deltaproteobacteria bacterium]|nr:hypothetical protein [Deltaproteobacteria bacterium]
MINILLVSPEKSTFKELETAFQEKKITAKWTDSAQNALLMFSKEKFDLFITHEHLTDMTGRELIEKALVKNAMMNSVAASTLSHDDFHKAYEGLGVLMQFPPAPGKEHVQNLLNHLNRITLIAGQQDKSRGEQD